jgi:hypothetical protein
MALIHRQSQIRHQASAVLQLAHAHRLSLWEAGLDPSQSGRPVLLACVGDVLGAESAITLQGTTDRPAAIATSGGLASAAIQLELVIGEGPVHDCTSRGLAVSAPNPVETWPVYGGAIADLGVSAVAASPLAAGGSPLGVLVTFNAPQSGPDGKQVHLPAVAAAVTETLLEVGPPQVPGLCVWDVVAPPEQDVAALLHCASGMVAEVFGCPPEEALDIMFARAADTGLQIESVARGIIGASPGGSGADTSE